MCVCVCVCVCECDDTVGVSSLILPLTCVVSVPQAKYHEDFERARGRGGTPGLDDPGMERYHRANQMMGEAAYSKGIHPQAMEMDRRPGGIIVGQ